MSWDILPKANLQYFLSKLKTIFDTKADKSELPTVNNATLTIQKNGTTVETFTANSSSNKTANISVPTKLSDLTDDVVSGHYLPLTGGTLYNGSNDVPLGIKCHSGFSGSYICFKDSANTALGYIGVRNNNLPYFYHNGNTRIALESDLSSYLPLAGGNMTGASGIQFPTTSGNNKTGNWISAGGGYSSGSGKSGVKIIVCEQSDCISGLGQDCSGLSGGYEMDIIAGANTNNNCYIAFLSHKVATPTTYSRLGYFDGGGNFYASGAVTVGNACKQQYNSSTQSLDFIFV